MIKICGVTNVDDAEICIGEGADVIGLNFVAASPRCVSIEIAREISRAVGRARTIGVVADFSIEQMRRLVDEAALGALQLHGAETPEMLRALMPRAYKAVRIATQEDVDFAMTFDGDYVLLDAKSPGALGGTGETFDWSLAARIAKERRVMLAGGLTPENVQDAIRALSPHFVDVASGVEEARNPRKKDVSRVRAFVDAVRQLHSSKQ